MNHLFSWIRGGAMVVSIALISATSLRAAASEPSFSSTLSSAQRAAMGLDKLSPEQLAALDAAIASYRHSSEVVVAKHAAESAVADYKRQVEPAAAARAVEAYKKQQAEAHQELIEAKIDGRFTGWDGHTIFRLDNGQIWRQVGSDLYYTSPEQNTAVEIRHSKYGSYRLHISSGAWVTVVRIH